MVSWQQALVAAQADVNVGNYVSAIQVLEQALDDAKEMVAGTAIDDLLPKTFGLLGTAYYRAGDRNKAREYTLRAREHCARIGDEEGRDIYTRNLETIGAPAAIAFRDAQGRLLTADELRAATGTFRYEVLGGSPFRRGERVASARARGGGARTVEFHGNVEIRTLPRAEVDRPGPSDAEQMMSRAPLVVAAQNVDLVSETLIP
jgi:hypothetical protein